jgi:fatty-acyl-CoA synthase
MILSGGENIYLAEVEGALAAHPAIQEIAVVGLPDPRWGETVVAVVVLRDAQTITLEELREWGRQSLAKYKLPRLLHEVAVLPRNATGKVQKFQLRDELGQKSGWRSRFFEK